LGIAFPWAWAFLGSSADTASIALPLGLGPPRALRGDPGQPSPPASRTAAQAVSQRSPGRSRSGTSATKEVSQEGAGGTRAHEDSCPAGLSGSPRALLWSRAVTESEKAVERVSSSRSPEHPADMGAGGTRSHEDSCPAGLSGTPERSFGDARSQSQRAVERVSSTRSPGHPADKGAGGTRSHEDSCPAGLSGRPRALLWRCAVAESERAVEWVSSSRSPGHPADKGAGGTRSHEDSCPAALSGSPRALLWRCAVTESERAVEQVSSTRSPGHPADVARGIKDMTRRRCVPSGSAFGPCARCVAGLSAGCPRKGSRRPPQTFVVEVFQRALGRVSLRGTFCERPELTRLRAPGGRPAPTSKESWANAAEDSKGPPRQPQKKPRTPGHTINGGPAQPR
jgi:hypothetical protein